MSDEDKLPPSVEEALVELETATTPVDLGRPYKLVLDWRRRRRFRVRDFERLFCALIYFGAVYLLQQDTPDFWRGIFVGIGVGAVAHIISEMLRTDSVRRRVDTAIDRWRHLAPAMRDVPQ